MVGGRRGRKRDLKTSISASVLIETYKKIQELAHKREVTKSDIIRDGIELRLALEPRWDLLERVCEARGMTLREYIVDKVSESLKSEAIN